MMCMNEAVREKYTTPRIKIKGSGCEFWSGVVGLSDKLVVFDGEIPTGVASDFSVRARRALADGMIERWKAFREGEVR